MKFRAKVQNNSYSLEVGFLDDSRYKLCIGGENFEVDVCHPEEQVMSLIINGRSYEVYQSETEKESSYQVGSHTFVVQLEDPFEVKQGKGTKAEGGVKAVTSPMPGRIVSLRVKVGEKVEEGQGVIVVEAMKMENELMAPFKGIVKEIKVKEGAAVDSGQELVVIEG
ncbi:MAG: hypothetical protein A3I75_04805 [Deltaproteobacteria bacterium RIFCSPLOWO2_02_FULL_50_16]|nr:MAG: hypothetical protein A3B79_01735 [Deltaproteobacteria bacterium RIFCSPHIGHO2_02_FULL_50_15]OGQ57516.1 MAG: hypothetical protein A3I75_04805 [Deltaproteobacteria bacterium RIFCSPLOWO2_02_FULL_50_16]OGQ66707.1 MAG: hypothetical protein A3F89_03170 [Deltaproteobacteria bacterium RIFCSPLOWO2_12_FULL_50_11]